MRAERRGNTIIGATSAEGKTWKHLKPADVLWPKGMKIGVHAAGTSGAPFPVNFDEFTPTTI